MSEYKKYDKKKDESEGKEASTVRIDDDVGFWLNKTKSGKGVIIVIGNDAFISSLINIKEFAEGKRRGVKFNQLKPKED